MKYIILDDGELERGIAFPESIQHVDMADACKRFGLPVSAGFVHAVSFRPHDDDSTRETKIVCRGLSDSLNLKSRPEDADFFANLLDPDYYERS
jgi:hypothetical protein